MRQSIKHIRALRQQGAIGGEHRNKTFFLSHLYKLWQLSMKKRFAHEMEIQELDFALKSRSQRIKFFHRQSVLSPCRLWAKHTIEITNIGYFKIASGYHVSHTLFILFLSLSFILLQRYKLKPNLRIRKARNEKRHTTKIYMISVVCLLGMSMRIFN